MSGTVTPPRGDHCPSCERFIGPSDHCPYCGEASARAPVLRRLRAAALLLAFGGLAFLYLMVNRRDLPVVRVDAITPMMNFAYVRVVGRVVHEPRLSDREGSVDYCSFLVDDGSGALRVQAYRGAAHELAANGSLPHQGELVDVAGSLMVTADDTPRLRLQAVEQLRILGPSGDG
ncbi:MAG: hypothetical protein K8T26_14415 [Lentisphaerae bacterium]|nr:hypothetical protein [Lentisphaerota bacterium]